MLPPRRILPLRLLIHADLLRHIFPQPREFQTESKGIITSENKNLGEWHEERIAEPKKQLENLDGDAITTKQQ